MSGRERVIPWDLEGSSPEGPQSEQNQAESRKGVGRPLCPWRLNPGAVGFHFGEDSWVPSMAPNWFRPGGRRRMLGKGLRWAWPLEALFGLLGIMQVSWFSSNSRTRVVFQSLSCVQLLVTPWTTAHQASLSITNSQSLLKLMSIDSVMPSNHLILWHPLILLQTFQNQDLFQWVTSLHQVAKVLDLQYQCFQWTFTVDFL